MSDERILLLCARADRAQLVPNGSTFDKLCSRCGQHVALAPSGVKFLLKTNAEIVCLQCHNPAGTIVEGLSAGPDDFEKEMGSLQPSNWMTRN